jgi:hypothetical protein
VFRALRIILSFDNFPDARLLEVKNATEKDASLQSVTEFILNGWPEDKDRVHSNNNLRLSDNCDLLFRKYQVQSCSTDIHHYHVALAFRDSFAISIPGVIVKGEAIFIPKMLRAEMKSRLHSSHLGYDSMMPHEWSA